MSLDEFYLIMTYVLAGILGLCVGSFLNVLIYRLPRSMNIAVPGSHCPDCGYSLKWYDNIPVVSYIILRGRCRSCGGRISPRYTVVEVLTCLLWLACVWRFYDAGIGMVIVACVAVSALTVVFFADMETMTIPDSMTVGIALCGIAAAVLEYFGMGDGIGWLERLIGGVAGFAFFALFYFGYLFLHKKEGLGFGDVKLMGAAGLLLGWKNLLFCVILSSILALICVQISRFVQNRRKKREEKKRMKAEAARPAEQPAAEDGVTASEAGGCGMAASAEGLPGETQADAAAEGFPAAEGAPAEEAADTADEDGTPEGAFPFAPYLAIGTAFSFFFADGLIAWYLAALGL